MNFLAPWFWLGALAVAGPLIFHLVRRTTRERVPFSSLLFLRPVPPRLTRRNRLEHLLLLALRCLVLVLLAAGFARPFLQQLFPALAPEGPARRTVLLVDTSASMRRGDLWSQALARADALLRRAGPADQVAVFTFDRTVTPRVTFEQWSAAPVNERAALARAQLAAIQPGWAATHLDTALIRAAELAAEPAAAAAELARQVVVLSDLQTGSRTAALQGHEWPREVTFRFEPLPPPRAGNAALHWLPESDETAPPAEGPAAVRLRVANSPDATREQFRVGWAAAGSADFAAPPLEVYVPPGQSRVVALAPLPNAPAGAVRLTGDEEPFDNLVFVAPPQPVPLRVLYFGREPAGDPRSARFFLERAFPPTRHREVRVLAPDPAHPPPAAELEDAALAVVTVPFSPDLGAALRPLLARGRAVLFVPPDAAAAASLAELVPGARLAAEERQPADYALLAELDFQHPLLAPFADPRFSDFSKIRFWRHRRLDLGGCPEARVLARFDSGDPALVDLPAGRGRVLVWAAGWQPAESQLALATKFVPLLHGVLDLSAGPPPVAVQFSVGEPIPLPELPAAARAAAAMRGPDGVPTPLPAGATQFERTDAPGLYELVAGETVWRRAVNLAPGESRLEPLAVEELERLGVPVTPASPPPALAAAQQQRLLAAELENRQKLWRWCLVAALGLVALETFLAGRAARRHAMLQPVSS
jgi:hypothetical protein